MDGGWNENSTCKEFLQVQVKKYKDVDIEGAKVDIENKKSGHWRLKSGHSKEIIVLSAREFYRTPNILQ